MRKSRAVPQVKLIAGGSIAAYALAAVALVWRVPR